MLWSDYLELLATEEAMPKTPPANLDSLADTFEKLYGPGSEFDRRLLAQRERHSERLKKTEEAMGTKSPAERKREEARKAEAARAAEKKAGPFTEAARAAIYDARPFDFGRRVTGIWHDTTLPDPPSPAPGPTSTDKALRRIEEEVNRQAATLADLANILPTLRERLDLIDSTVLNIQQQVTKHD